MNKVVLLLIYAIAINIIAFCAFGIDKKKAERGARRISEKTLIIIAVLGGALGSLVGMVAFKHKLSKPKFYIGIPTIAVLVKILESFIIYKIVVN